MRQIQLTRQAIQDLRNLQGTGSLKVPERLFDRLAETPENDRFVHTISLSGRGFADLWRSRLDLGGGSSLRLIWILNQEDGSIRILYAAQRNDDTYDIDIKALPREPAYTWNGEKDIAWSFFLNGGYNYSPVMTQAQKLTSDQIGQHTAVSHYGENPRIGFFAHITQSPPGTGKTVTAALRACDLYKMGWNVLFLLPQSLLEEVKEFHCLQSIPSDMSQGFFYGTFQDWVKHASPESESSMLSPDEELKILQDLAQRAEQSQAGLNFQGIRQRDLILYQSFVLKPDSDQTKNTVYQENADRIEVLKRISPEWWDQACKDINKLSRSDIATRLCEQWEQTPVTLPTKDRVGITVIIDESQDYLLSELEAIKKLCRGWQEAGQPTYLWLLGDLNQRIMPVDFDWGALELVNVQEPDWKCFRNSKRILEFSNLFLAPASENARQNKARCPYQPTEADYAYKTGEKVKLIKYPSPLEAEVFLEKLCQSLGRKIKAIEASKSLIYKLVSRVKVLYAETYQSKYNDQLEFLNVHEVKGREFDTSVVFNAFKTTTPEPTSEDWWQWYTLLTRTRSRLVIVITEAQYQLLQRYLPNLSSVYELIDYKNEPAIDNLIHWLQAEDDELILALQKKNIIRQYILDALQLESVLIYRDMYEVLDQINFKEEERSLLEREMILCLQQRSLEELKVKLALLDAEKANPLLQSLVLRAMGHYWDGARRITSLQQTHSAEYDRVMEAIAQDLEAVNLVVEAARFRFQMQQIPYPKHLPLPEIAQAEGNLITALVKILKSQDNVYTKGS